MATKRDITTDDHVFAGDDRTIEIVVFTDDDQAQVLDCTNADLVWTLSTWDFSPSAIIEKSTAVDPGGITVTGTYDPDPAINTQRVVVALDAEDTQDLTLHRYRYALKRTNDGARATLMYGYFYLLHATTAQA